MYNGNGLDQRSGTVWYVPCIKVTGWIKGQVLSGMYLYNINGLEHRSGTFPLKGIHLCGVSAGSTVLLR